jgi:hypothetical protein
MTENEYSYSDSIGANVVTERWVKLSAVMKALDPSNNRDQKLENMRALIANAIPLPSPVSDEAHFTEREEAVLSELMVEFDISRLAVLRQGLRLSQLGMEGKLVFKDEETKNKLSPDTIKAQTKLDTPPVSDERRKEIEECLEKGRARGYFAVTEVEEIVNKFWPKGGE